MLTSLVDKSLVRREHADCYQMHELLKTYAAEKLADDADREREARDQHSAFYSDLAFSHQSAWGNRDQPISLGIFKSEIYNLLQAWDWNITRADVHRLDQMISSVNEFHPLSGKNRQGDK